jgi:hypothetical protein
MYCALTLDCVQVFSQSKRKRTTATEPDRTLPLKKQHRAMVMMEQDDAPSPSVSVVDSLQAMVVTSLEQLSAEDRGFVKYALMDPSGLFMMNPLYLALEPEVVVAEDADLDIMSLQVPPNSTGTCCLLVRCVTFWWWCMRGADYVLAARGAEFARVAC